MTVVTTLRNVSLGIAAASFLLAGAAFAESTGLTGVTARLDQAINAQTARQGERVEAKLDRTLKSNTGLDLPKGTELVGKVSRVQASENGGPSQISLVFTNAQLKDGKQLPVKVMLVGAYPPSAGGGGGYGQQTMGAAPRHIGPQHKVDQEAGVLSHISMVASAQGHNSATFRDKNGNVRLRQGTYFQVGIAPQNGSGMMNSGA